MKTILVVDDEFGIVDALKDLLAYEGYRVVTAANGRDGLAQLEAEHPDLVMLDLMMPIMSGQEMLRAMPSKSAVLPPVILMSAATEPRALASSQGQYAAFLRKPFELQVLLDLIESLIGPADHLHH